MRTPFAVCAVLLSVMLTAGCVPDFDKDGLSDADEAKVYHTSPETSDTDGDGYSDYQEIHELG